MTDGVQTETSRLKTEGLKHKINELAGAVNAARGLKTIGERAAGLPKAKKQQILDTLLGKV